MKQFDRKNCKEFVHKQHAASREPDRHGSLIRATDQRCFGQKVLSASSKAAAVFFLNKYCFLTNNEVKWSFYF